MFAHAVYLGDRNWNLKEASDILVTLSEELNIVIPANEANPAVYIDVPLDSILEVSFDNTLIPDSQLPIYGVEIRLDSGVTTNCILNAIGYVEHHMALAFSSDKDANTLKRLLIPTNFRADGSALRGRSGVSDASEQQILSEDELAAHGPALSNSQILIGTASLEDVMIPHGHAAGTIDPSMLERGHSSQRASTAHNEDSLIVGHRVAMAAEGIDVSQNDILVEQAIEGIDVSQNEDLSHEENQHGNTQAYLPDKASSNAPVQNARPPGNGKQKAIGNFDRELDIGPSSSLRRHKGHNAIENIPQLRAQPSENAVSYSKQIENRRGPKGQDGEHDDLFYASPKATNGRRRSPRSLARANTPKSLDLSLEPIVRRANAKSGPPVKLSKQLRNAEGVVESHTEQTADDGLTALTKNNAVDVGISANRKKIRVPAPVKIGNGLKGSAKPAKKTAQSKRKAVATEEPADTSLDSYEVPPSPKGADTIQIPGNKTQATSTRLKATRAPRNKQKKAKPMPTKAATAASSKQVAPQVRDELKNNAKANGSVQNSPNRPSSKKIDEEDDAIWDVDQAHGGKERHVTRRSRQPAKIAKKQGVRVSTFSKNKAQSQLQSDQAKVNKPPTAHDQDTVASLVKAKATPAALSQARPRRTAAIKANKKIQGLEESDDIVDEEEAEPALTRIKRHIPLTAAKSRKGQKVRNGDDDRETSSGKIPTAKPSTKDFIPDSVSPDSSDKERPNSVSDPKADSSPEKVNLPRDAAAGAIGAVADDKRDNLLKGNSTRAAETSRIPLHPELFDRSNQPDPIYAEQGAGLSEARVDLVPDSVPQLRGSISKTEPAPISSQRDGGVKQGHYDLDNMRSVGPGDQDEVENVVRCIDDGSLTLNSNLDDVEEKVAHPQAPTAPMAVRIRKNRTSPRPTGAAEKTLPEPTPTRRDPFMAKLNALIPPSKGTNAKVKSSEFTRDVNLESRGPNTSNSGGLGRSLQESKARALNTPGGVPSGEAEPFESSRRRLKSPMQMDGESSAIKSLKPAGQSISASGVEAKRKTEQIGDMSNKRVKLVSKERLKGASAKKTPAFDANKTPPPAVSNRPLVIGFSASGPRNQGTISTKKSKPPKDVENGAPDVAELRKHEVPNPAVSQVHADFASNQEALETSVEDIQPEVKVAAGVQREAPGSTRRKQAGHVNAAVIGEAQTQENGAEKRKLAPFPVDPAPGQHEQPSKRQKRNMETPPPAQKHHPRMFPDMSPALVHDRSQRISSQNTRVNENGSPMPFFIGSTIAEEQYSDDEDDGKDALAEARLAERFVLQEDDTILPEPILPLQPLVSAVSTTQPKARAYQSLSNNSKQIPSSPHASSAFATMPPHHLYHDGEIVNVETKQSILPAKPQDPFLGATQRPPNSFMDALRKSTEFAAKSLVSGAEAKRDLGGVVMCQNVNVGEDPDKTLVEPKSRKRYRKVHVSDSSSSSQSGSSTQVSQPYESSEEDSEAETEARWRKELEPHQENMLECLLTISHVSNDLTILLAGH